MIKKFIAMLIATGFNIANAQENLAFSTEKKIINLSTGIKMHYVETGTGENGTVILLHGYTDTGRSFFPTIDVLHSKNPGLRIIAPDLRGHGNTSMPTESVCAGSPNVCFTFAEFSKDIIDLMDQLKISSAFIVGHSMGSVVTQELALQYPKRVKGIVLIESYANGNNNAFVQNYLLSNVVNSIWKSYSATQKGTWPSNVYTTRPIDIDTIFTNWVKREWVVDPTADENYINEIYPETMQIQLGTWIGAIGPLSTFDNRERLKKIKVSTLVLWATQDGAMLENPDQDDLKKALGIASMKNNIMLTFKTYGKKPLPPSGLQVDDYGHNLQWGAPIEVATDILSFIKTGKPTEQHYFAGSSPKR